MVALNRVVHVLNYVEEMGNGIIDVLVDLVWLHLLKGKLARGNSLKALR